jgi:hypothetical protein
MENQYDQVLIARLAALEARFDNLMLLEARIKRVESRSWVVNVFGGVGIVAIATFAFFLGAMNNSINRLADKTDRIYTVVLESSKDSLASRTSVIEEKIDGIDKKLDKLASGKAPGR